MPLGCYAVIFLVCLGLAAALPRPGSRAPWLVLVLVLFAVPPLLLWQEDRKVIAKMEVAATQVDHRRAQAWALFQERCKDAGVKIQRTVDTVERVLWMKWRPRSGNQYDQYRLDDPFGYDCGAENCILDLLRVSRGASLNPEAARKHLGKHDFVETIDPPTGRRTDTPLR